MLAKYISMLKLLYFIGKMILHHEIFLSDIICLFYKQNNFIIYCYIKGIERKTTELSPINNKFIVWVEKASKA